MGGGAWTTRAFVNCVNTSGYSTKLNSKRYASSMGMANHISMLAKEWGLDIPEPTSINKVVNRGGHPGKYLIDELEMCLRQLGIDPVAATMWDGSDMKARDLD